MEKRSKKGSQGSRGQSEAAAGCDPATAAEESLANGAWRRRKVLGLGPGLERMRS